MAAKIRRLIPAENCILQMRQPIRFHFEDADRIYIHGVEHRFVECPKHGRGYIFARADNPNMTVPLTWEQMDAIDKGHHWRYERAGYDLQRSRTVLRTGIDRMRDLPKEEQERIRFKVDVIERYLKLKQQGLASGYDPSIKRALEVIVTDRAANAQRPKHAGHTVEPPRKMPDPGTLRDWIKLYIGSGMDPMSLRSNRCNSGPRGTQFGPEEYAVLYEYACKYLSLEKPTIARLHRDMTITFKKTNARRRRAGEPDLEAPSEDTLANLIHSFDAYDVMAAREGPEEAEKCFRSVNQGPPKFRAGQRVEMDAWYVHLWNLVILTGLWKHLSKQMKEKLSVRMVLSMAIDCASRVYLGISLSATANAQSSLKTVRMVFTDKTPLAIAAGCATPWEYRCRPELFVFDGGSENANDLVTNALTDFKIKFEVPKGGAPSARGTVERGFHTIDQKLISRFSGRTFKNPAARKKYAAMARACVSVEELVLIIIRYLADDYHNTPHSGLGGMTPRAKWLELTKRYGVTPSPDVHEIRVVMGDEMTATLGPKGIRCLGNWYRSQDVQTLFEKRRRAEVTIRYDRENLGWISFKKGNDWVTAPGPKVMRGVSAATWLAAEASLRRQRKDFARLLEPIVQEAIDAAIKLDEEARKRIGITDSPMSPDMIEQAHRRMTYGIEFAEDSDAEPPRPADLFDNMVRVGTKPARPRARVPNAHDPAATCHNSRIKPTRTPNRRKPVTEKPEPAPARRTKPTRAWKIKERRR